MNEFGVAGDYEDELKRIVACVKELRTKKSGKVTEWTSAAECHMKYSNLNGNPALALTITLSPTGCEWARKGGCTMCGEFEGASKRNSLIENPQFHVAQFAAAIGKKEVWEIAKEERMPIEWLRINQEGNFSNINEVNSIAQESILRLAIRIGGIKRITIESRPQYLTEEVVAFLSSIVVESGVELEIGMGVEAQNEVVRNICINKQGSSQQFVDAVELLKKYSILPLAYVLLKPPFLTEQESIEEAVATAHFAADIGFERISFEPMSIHRYTLVDALVKTGDYKAPWLWSVVEVAKKCVDISSIFGIGGIGYYPIPQEYSSNVCENRDGCTQNFAEAIKKYNASRDIHVFDSLSCECRLLWEKECSRSSSSLKVRMQEQLLHVEKLMPSYSVVENKNDNTLRNTRVLMSSSQ